MVARKPRIHGIIGGPCFAIQVTAFEHRLRPCRSAGTGNFLQQLRHHKSVTAINGAIHFSKNRWRGFHQYFAALFSNLGNQPRVDSKAAVSKHRVAHCHLHGRDRASAQSHGQVGGVFGSIKTKTRNPVLSIGGTYRLQNTNRHHVFGFSQRPAHSHGALKGTIVIFRLPGLATRHACIKKQRSIINDGGGGKPFFERCRVDEWLKTRTWLTPRLRHVVKFVFGKVKTANQRLNRAITWVKSNKGTFHFWQLRDFPASFAGSCNANHGTPSDFDVRRCLVR